MLLTLNHVQITVPKGQEKEARAFYCTLLGLEEIKKPDVLKPNGGFWLQLGQVQLHIGTESNSGRHKTKAHIAYQVSNITEWRNRFETENITITENQQIPGFDRFDVRDPFGNRLEFMAKKP